MLCPGCGSSVQENAAFCTNCGAVLPPSVLPQEKTVAAEKSVSMDIHLQKTLSILVGFAFLCVAEFICNRIALRAFGSTVNPIPEPLRFMTVLLSVLGIVADLNASEKRFSSILLPALEFLFMMCMLLLSRQLVGLFGNEWTITDSAVYGMRLAVAPMFIVSAAVCIFGLCFSEKTFRSVFFIELALLLLSVIIMLVCVYVFHLGLAGAALCLGIMQPVAALLPNLGRWKGENSRAEVAAPQAGIAAASAPSQMFCTRCGSRFPAETVYCTHCGGQLIPLADTCVSAVRSANALDAPSFGFGVLGFFLPVVGLILFLVWHDSYPQRAKSAGKGALIATILYVVFVLVYLVAVLAPLFSLR